MAALLTMSRSQFAPSIMPLSDVKQEVVPVKMETSTSPVRPRIVRPWEFSPKRSPNSPVDLRTRGPSSQPGSPVDLRTRGPSSQPNSPVDLCNPVISPYVINIVPDDTYAEPMSYQSGYMLHRPNMSVYQSTSPNDKHDSRVSLYQSTPDISLVGSLPQLSDVSVYQSTSPDQSPASRDSGYNSDLSRSGAMATPVSNRSSDKENDIHFGRNYPLNHSALQLLEAWYLDNIDHPYPTRQTVDLMADRGNITGAQVRKWMANKRARNMNTRGKGRNQRQTPQSRRHHPYTTEQHTPTRVSPNRQPMKNTSPATNMSPETTMSPTTSMSPETTTSPATSTSLVTSASPVTSTSPVARTSPATSTSPVIRPPKDTTKSPVSRPGMPVINGQQFYMTPWGIRLPITPVST